MTEFLAEYGLFLAKALTVVVAVVLTVAGIVLVSSAGRKSSTEGEISVTCLNDELEDMRHCLEEAVLDKAEYKAQLKAEKKQEKEEEKARKKELRLKGKSAVASKDDDVSERGKRCYVLDFTGDMHASEVEQLREEITAVLTLADERDEVIVRLESPGGLVHAYGLASSQLERIRRCNIPLTICVDQVAASGGYMMACLADKLLAAPFAVIGSIGVVAQMPNFHRLLKKHDVDVEILTAGEYKRTLTMFGENTEKGRQKFVEELEDTHELFKDFVGEYRSQLDVEQVATGEIWFGKRALEMNLVDALKTSDEYLSEACEDSDVFLVRYEMKKSLQERIADMGIHALDRVFTRIWEEGLKARFLSR